MDRRGHPAVAVHFRRPTGAVDPLGSDRHIGTPPPATSMRCAAPLRRPGPKPSRRPELSFRRMRLAPSRLSDVRTFAAAHVGARGRVTEMVSFGPTPAVCACGSMPAAEEQGIAARMW